MGISGRSRSRSITTLYCNMGAVILVALVVVGAGVAPGVVQARVVIEPGCPEVEYAYPFQSVCQKPAEFGKEYHLVAPYSNVAVAQGGFTPDSESLIRFTANKSDEGANYVLAPVSAEGDTTNITLATPVTLTNSQTGKTLGWQFRAWQRGFLLAELEDATAAAQFVLQIACPVSLPCPETTGARCESYFFLSATDGATGFLATIYFNQGYAYVTRDHRGTSGNLPLLLRRVRTHSINIRQVEA